MFTPMMLAAFRDELIKISSGASDILKQRAEELWRAKSQAAEKASSLPHWQRAESFWKAKEQASSGAKKGAKKGLSLLQRLL